FMTRENKLMVSIRLSLLLGFMQVLLLLLVHPSACFAATNGLGSGNFYFFAVTSYNPIGLDSLSFTITDVNELAPATVEVITPPDGSSGTDLVSISVNTPESVGLAKAQLLVNGIPIAETSTPPYIFFWDTSTLIGGNYLLSVKAFDAAGSEMVSDNVEVTVAGDTIPPALSINT